MGEFGGLLSADIGLFYNVKNMVHSRGIWAWPQVTVTFDPLIPGRGEERWTGLGVRNTQPQIQIVKTSPLLQETI